MSNIISYFVHVSVSFPIYGPVLVRAWLTLWYQFWVEVRVSSCTRAPVSVCRFVSVRFQLHTNFYTQGVVPDSYLQVGSFLQQLLQEQSGNRSTGAFRDLIDLGATSTGIRLFSGCLDAVVTCLFQKTVFALRMR
jgi:hypothetical protein